MRAKDIVQDYYSHAVAQYTPPSNQVGQATAYQQGEWNVYRTAGLGEKPIGSGPTEDAAWIVASTEVMKKFRTPTSLLIPQEKLEDALKYGKDHYVIEEINRRLETGETVHAEKRDKSRGLVERDGDKFKIV